MSDEAYVRVAADSTGKKVRNVQLEVLQPDGTYATVLMQVVSIVDMDGRAIDFGANETATLLRSLLREVTALRKMYGRSSGLQFIALDGGMLDNQAGE